MLLQSQAKLVDETLSGSKQRSMGLLGVIQCRHLASVLMVDCQCSSDHTPTLVLPASWKFQTPDKGNMSFSTIVPNSENEGPTNYFKPQTLNY
jgi:hypothetical protein